MNEFNFNFVRDQNAGTTETFGFNDFERFKLTILRAFFWKVPAHSVATEASNLTITSLKGELGLQLIFFQEK